MTGESRGIHLHFRSWGHVSTSKLSLSWKSSTAATLCYSFDRFFRIPCCRFHGGNSFGSVTFTFDRGDLQLLVMKGQAGQTVHGPWLSCWVGVGKWSAVTSKISTGWDHLGSFGRVISPKVFPHVSPNRLPCSLASSYLQQNPRKISRNWMKGRFAGIGCSKFGLQNSGFHQSDKPFFWLDICSDTFFIRSFGLSLHRYPKIPWIIHVHIYFKLRNTHFSQGMLYCYTYLYLNFRHWIPPRYSIIYP